MHVEDKYFLYRSMCSRGTMSYHVAVFSTSHNVIEEQRLITGFVHHSVVLWKVQKAKAWSLLCRINLNIWKRPRNSSCCRDFWFHSSALLLLSTSINWRHQSLSLSNNTTKSWRNLCICSGNGLLYLEKKLSFLHGTPNVSPGTFLTVESRYFF